MVRLRRAGAIVALNLLVVAGLAVGAAPAHAVTCAPATPAPTNTYPGTTVLATSFETPTIAAAGFTAPITAGTGTATISDATANKGRCAAKLHVTTAPGSLANFSAPLPAGSKDVYADGWFNVAARGVDGNNVPYFRFFTNGTRVLDVYRSNNGIGALWLRVASPTGTPTYTRLVPSVNLNSWHHLTLHAVANGAATTVEIWFDDKLVFASGQVAIDVNTVSAVQLGAEHRRQAGDVYIDDVIIKSSKGAAAQPGTFAAITPTRMLDTRRSASPVASNSTVSFQVAGVGGVPAKVASVVFNLTVTSPQRAGFITAFASGTPRPDASNLNFAPGQTVPNLVTVPVGNDGRVTLYNRSDGSSHLIADVTGYYVTGTPATPGAFRSLAPSRIFDTRNSAPVGKDAVVTFQVAGANGIPASVAAVVFNLTVTETRSFGFITAYPSGTGAATPNASNLNFSAGQTVPNLVTVPVGADGKVALFNRSDNTAQLIADVAGYYLPGTPTAPGAFKAIGPTRALDTRTAAPAARDSAVAFRVGGANGIPAKVSGVVFNLTVTAPESFGFVTAYPSGTAIPEASNLNFAGGQTVPNLVAVPVGSDGRVSLYNRSDGRSHLIADIAGYFLG